jgi:hypothetical protein
MNDFILTSRCSGHFTISKNTLEKSLNKEGKISHQRGAMARHAFKALRPLETGQTVGVTSEREGTLDGFRATSRSTALQANI